VEKYIENAIHSSHVMWYRKVHKDQLLALKPPMLDTPTTCPIEIHNFESFAE